MKGHVLRGIVLGSAVVLPAQLAMAQPLDPPFNTPKGFDCTYSANRSVDAIVPALDGSGDVYVAGRFTTYVDQRHSGLLRLNADGSVDTGFALGAGFDGSVFTIAAATDGSGDLYVGGGFTSLNGTPCNRIVRLDADGSVDSAFNVGAGFNSSVWSVAVATDGSGDVLVGGDFTSYKGVSGRNRIIRLEPDGSADATFTTGTGFNSTVLALAPASDGDVYVGGSFTKYRGTTGVNKIVRLNADGTIDAGFAAGSGFNLNSVNALALDAWGDLYVGGSFFKYQGLAADRIVRLNPDGSRDAGFDGGSSGGNGIVESLALANDGSGDVFIGGQFGSYKGIPGTARMARLNADGSVDANFATGTGFTGGLGGDLTIRAIAVAPDGSGDVLAGGFFAIYDGTAVDHFVRLEANGALDPATRLGAGFNNNVTALAATTDGSGDMYVGGSFGYYSAAVHDKLVRLDANGVADPGFATGTGFNSPVAALAVANDGSGDLYVGGAFYVYQVALCPRLVRLDSTGARDLAFDPADTVLNGVVNAVVPATDGSGDVFAGGNFTGRVVRLSPSGAVVHAAPGTGFNGLVNALVLVPDGSGDVIVVGAFTSYNGTASNRIVRLNSDLTIDTVAAGTGLNGAANAVAVSGTSVYVGGDFTQCQGIARPRICRLTSGLALDLTFDPGTGFSYPTGGTSVRCLLVTSTGRVYAGGKFETYRGGACSGIVAIHPDGTRDTGFVVGTGLNRTALALAEGQDAGRDLFVGGDFRSYQGHTVDFVVVLDPDGRMD